MIFQHLVFCLSSLEITVFRSAVFLRIGKSVINLYTKHLHKE